MSCLHLSRRPLITAPSLAPLVPPPQELERALAATRTQLASAQEALSAGFAAEVQARVNELEVQLEQAKARIIEAEEEERAEEAAAAVLGKAVANSNGQR